MTQAALTPLDGRYASKLKDVTACLSENALHKQRYDFEVRWLSALVEAGVAPPDHGVLSSLVADESVVTAIRAHERVTRHDVKAVELALADQLIERGAAELVPFAHFGLTSEDVNNMAYGKMLNDARNLMLGDLTTLLDQLRADAVAHAHTPMLSRTHGQPATPTTFGKEMAVFHARLERGLADLRSWQPTGKIAGATGTYAAMDIARPDIDWISVCQRVVKDHGLIPLPVVTQVEPKDATAALCHITVRINTILIDLARDMWQYISLGFVALRIQPGQVGSSTMPHKVNPIKFENAEGNLGVASALLGHLAITLPVSRMQRDLADSTSSRSLATGFGHATLAFRTLVDGLADVSCNADAMRRDLDHHWEVLAEAAQSVLRAEGVADAYNVLKQLSQGKAWSQQQWLNAVHALPVSPDAQKRLKELTPATYIGLAPHLI